MTRSAIMTFVYGLFLFSGGLMGFFYAGSVASLIAGGVSGVVIFVCAFFMLKNYQFAKYIVLVLSIVLGIFFTMRFYNTMSFMAGVMALLSGVMLIIMLIKIFHVGDLE